MLQKTILNPAITMPISQEVHAVICACGYRLKNQEMLHLEYEADGKRLTFNFGKGITYEQFWDETEDDRGPHWTTLFECRIHFAIDPIAMLDILNSVKAINYFILPEAKEAIMEAMNEVRKRSVQPLTQRQLILAVAS